MGYLSEKTRRRIAAALLAVGAAIAALAIADVGPFSDPPTEEELAEDTVEEFFAAAGEGDFDTVCDLLTKAARQGIEVRFGAIAAEEKLSDCAQILDEVIGKQLEGSELGIASSNVSGEAARVEAELKIKGEPGREQRSVLLELVGSDWLISRFL
jgi:hypothetical protein